MRLKLVHVLAAFVVAAPVFAHEGIYPSVHDTVAGVVQRMHDTMPTSDRKKLTAESALAFLTPEERKALGEGYLTFNVNVPVVISVMRDTALVGEPYWLEEREFARTEDIVKVGDHEFDVWTKEFDGGEVGLGVNSLTGRGEHYFVGVQAKRDRDAETLEITNNYPGLHSIGKFEVGAAPYTDRAGTITELPEKLAGAILVRGVNDRTRDAQLLGEFRETEHPSSAAPDHVVLTWSGDPQTTQTVQWRTGIETETGVVAFARKSDSNFDPSSAATVAATTRKLVQNTLLNDPIVYWHTATMTGLEPGATYTYAVGDGAGAWRDAAEFTTIPNETVPFSFFYMGDAQNGLDTWGNLVRKSFAHRPDASFYIMAGDLVNRGAERDDWDKLFANAEGIWDRRTVVPVPGNHEYQGGNAQWYLDQFALPTESPLGELNYTIRYSNALFIMLDSNRAIEEQGAWLEDQLANSDATWKIAVYHHPAYSSGLNRDNKSVRQVWGALFDKYHVDLALQGHDHAYLRTYPMRGQEVVDTAAEGTIYIVSVSGTKFYEQGNFAYTQFGMTNVSTYQVLDIKIDGNRLEYGAFDVDGTNRDTFVIQK
jgi:3',5'-cyclic AMP phosphodiesterase CpdA